MSFALARLLGTLKQYSINKVVPVRCFTRGSVFLNEETEEESSTKKERVIDPARDRRKKIPVETSIRYLASKAFKQSYEGNPVWKLYRRNHKGAIPPEKTRKSCIRGGVIFTGNPCPICRDEYLVLDYRNVELLKQFISEFNGEILSYTKTGLCQKQHKLLSAAILRAKNYGTITYDAPLRQYDYSEWNKTEEKNL